MRYLHLLATLLLVPLLLDACAPGAKPSDARDISDTAVAPAAATGAAAPTSPTSEETPASFASTAEANSSVTISFATQPELLALYEPLVGDFQQDNPNIHIRLVNLESLIKPVVTADGTFITAEGSMREILSGSDAADVSPTPEAIANGWVGDLRPLMDADPSFERDDFYAGTLEAFGQAGHQYLLPTWQWVDLLSYNKDLWARHGLAAPKPDWTWADLKAVAEQVVQKRSDAVEVYGMLDWEGGYRPLLAELADAGVRLDPSAPLHLDRPEVAGALERAAALAKSGAVYLPPQRWGSPEEYRKIILDQRVAIWPADLLDGSTAAKPAFAIGTVPFPSATVGVGGYVMSSGTQHPQEVWRWLAFLSRRLLPWPFGGLAPVPARKSVAEQSGYWAKLDPETAAAFKAVVGRPPTLLLPELGPRALVLLRQAVREVAFGEKTAAQALRAAQQQLDQQLAQEPTPTPVAGPIAVAAPAPEAPAGATVIVFGTFEEGSADATDRLAQAFNRASPGSFVQVKHISLTGGPPSLADLASQTDCFVGGGAPERDELTALRDLQPLIDADAQFKLDDYPQALLAPFRSAGGLYGLPYAVDFRVLNYNQAAFDAAGLAHPTAAWTLDDLAQAARQLTHGSGGDKQYGFASTFLEWRDVFFFLERLGVSATTGGGEATQPNFTDPQVARAIRAYLDLVRNTSPATRLAGYTRGDTGDADVVALATAGRVGMWFDFGTFGASAGRYQGFARAIAPPLLGQRALTSNDVRASGLYIAAQSQHPEACWEWLKYLSKDLTSLAGAFPARTSLAESDAFTGHAPPGAAEVYEAYRTALDRPAAALDLELASQSQIDYYWFFQAIDRALQGKDLARELATAQTLTEQFLACIAAGSPRSQCATEVDPAYQGRLN